MRHILLRLHHAPVAERTRAGAGAAEDNSLAVDRRTVPDKIAGAAGDSPGEDSNPAEAAGRPEGTRLAEGTRPVVVDLGCSSLLRSWMFRGARRTQMTVS